MGMNENQEYSIKQELNDVGALADAAKKLDGVSTQSLIVVGGIIVVMMILKIISKKFGK